MERLAGKVAIVSGGGGGIGSAVARMMCREGARVTVADIAEEAATRVAEPLGEQALALQFDAAQPESIRRMVQRTVEHFGRLDILDNNVADTSFNTISRDTTATDISLEVWNHTLSVNTTSHLLASKCAVPHMIANGGGCIINMASGSGLHGDITRIAYGASKAAVISLTQYIATQYGQHNIRCNAIAPGVIITRGLLDADPGLTNLILPHILLNRFGEPDDIAGLAVFLASDEAAYITGQTLSVDGGMFTHMPQYASQRPPMKE